jgi:hypothetical protein
MVLDAMHTDGSIVGGDDGAAGIGVSGSGTEHSQTLMASDRRFRGSSDGLHRVNLPLHMNIPPHPAFTNIDSLEKQPKDLIVPLFPHPSNLV